jgi:hypothetical protein
VIFPAEGTFVGDMLDTVGASNERNSVIVPPTIPDVKDKRVLELNVWPASARTEVTEIHPVPSQTVCPILNIDVNPCTPKLTPNTVIENNPVDARFLARAVLKLVKSTEYRSLLLPGNLHTVITIG